MSDTGFMKKIAADLTDGGEVQVTVVFELDDVPFAPTGVQDTITVTLPSAGTSGGILTGTGYITSCSLPSVEIGGLLEQSFTFTFDGSVGPTYTVGVA